MKIDWKDWTNWVGALLAASVAIFILNRVGSLLELSKSDWASWVQAIGAIVAIVGTWMGTKHQIQHGQRVRALDRVEADSRLATACAVLAADVAKAVRGIQIKFVGSTTLGFAQIGTTRLEQLLNMISAAANKDLPSDLFAHLLPLSREVAYTLTAVQEYNRERKVASPLRIAKARKRAETVYFFQDAIRTIAIELDVRATWGD